MEKKADSANKWLSVISPFLKKHLENIRVIAMVEDAMESYATYRMRELVESLTDEEIDRRWSSLDCYYQEDVNVFEGAKSGAKDTRQYYLNKIKEGCK